jgi:hypothetical protein
MIVNDLAADGNYTRATSVYEVTMEPDALRKFLSDVRDVLAYEAKNSEALKMITDLVNERKVADED